MNQAPVTLCGSLSLHPSPLGRAMHEAGYRALGLAFSYVPFAATDLAGALVGMRALGIRGLGVSMPFKERILPLLDRLDPLAARIGAVNTVVNDGGVLTGYNTDAEGASRALAEVIDVAGKSVLLLGAGGAARAVLHALREQGARLHLVNRSRAKADELAATCNGAPSRMPPAESTHAVRPESTRTSTPESEATLLPAAAERLTSLPPVTAGSLASVVSLDGYDVVVNCTSRGMQEYGTTPPIAPTLLRPGTVVMDIVYKPVFTELVRAAQRALAPTVHGGRMLLHQACRQFELYTGALAPLSAMEAAQREILESD